MTETFRPAFRPATRTAGQLTPNQRATLCRIDRASGEAQGWVQAKHTGAPAAAARLADFGLVEQLVEKGPRGGEYVMYRPTDAGRRAADYVRLNQLKTW